MGLFNSAEFKFSFSNNEIMITSDVGSSTRSGVADRSFELCVNSNMVNLALVKPIR